MAALHVSIRPLYFLVVNEAVCCMSYVAGIYHTPDSMPKTASVLISKMLLVDPVQRATVHDIR